MNKNSIYLIFTIGRINRSNFGGFRVNPSPTKQGLVTKRFHVFSKIKNLLFIDKNSIAYFVVFQIEQHEILRLH